ncbi:hypothetical protein BKK56_07260 [Rodentibacter genomosp. 2]|uniref:hypothetical protein n=1 Tax=Rodentibacter genomosp. 2 TaxID=1908266 RepID=UPI000984CA38|nr:hypothetical protein BKK56_07260 [Rodentibacter genomosp. 2]
MFDKLITALLLLLFSSSSSTSSCISEKEYKNIKDGLPSNGEYYFNVPNMVDCKKQTNLSNLICNDKKLEDAMMLLSIGFIYAYENATHTPVEDYSTYNNDFRDWLSNLIANEKDENKAMRKLCYIIKSETWNSFGVGTYYDPMNVHEVISSRINSNGVVIDTLSQVIYLGKSCDVVILGEKNIKRIWYNDNKQFVIAKKSENGNLKEEYRFNYDDKVYKLNCPKP